MNIRESGRSFLNYPAVKRAESIIGMIAYGVTFPLFTANFDRVQGAILGMDFGTNNRGVYDSLRALFNGTCPESLEFKQNIEGYDGKDKYIVSAIRSAVQGLNEKGRRSTGRETLKPHKAVAEAVKQFVGRVD